MQIEDGLVDRWGVAQIVGVDDQFHRVSDSPGMDDILQGTEVLHSAIIDSKCLLDNQGKGGLGRCVSFIF